MFIKCGYIDVLDYVDYVDQCCQRSFSLVIFAKKYFIILEHNVMHMFVLIRGGGAVLYIILLYRLGFALAVMSDCLLS